MNYTIQNYDDYYSTGTTGNDEQVVMGLIAPDIVIYFFDQEGFYLRQKSVPLPNPPEKDSESGIYLLDSHFIARFADELAEVKRQFGYQPGPISIETFFDPKNYVGVSSYPSNYQEFLDYPDRFSEEEKQAYESYIKQWDDDECFVFCWGEEYWMNSNGEIESS
jgi:hypothetical protein